MSHGDMMSEQGEDRDSKNSKGSWGISFRYSVSKRRRNIMPQVIQEKNHLPQTWQKNGRRFFSSPVELMLPELAQSSKIRFIVVHII